MAASYDVAFVDSISSTATVRLNLHAGKAGWSCLADGTEFPPPPLERVESRSQMTDGSYIPSAAYRNRTIVLALEWDSSATADAAALAVQALAREIDRPGGSILRYRPDTTNPVFFKCMRSSFAAIDVDPIQRRATLALLAEPFAYGPRETLSTTLVGVDPADGPTLNSNSGFETAASPWAANGGSSTAVRSTAQFNQGVASLLLTPDGATASVDARSENVPATVGVVYRASAWVRCAASRNVAVNINWRDAGSGLLSTTTATVAVTLNTWTLITAEGTAPASTAFAQMTVSMGSTPSASHLLYIDEARIRAVGLGNGLSIDIASPKGDVETPLHLKVEGANGVLGRITSALGIRRRGTPANAPVILQAEAMTQGTNTTTQANSTSFSGTGNNYSRCTFTSVTMQTRLSVTKHPASASVDARGTYRVFLRLRKNTGGDVVNVRLRWGISSNPTTNDTVNIGADTNLKYVDLGLVAIPAGYDPVSDGVGGADLPVEGIHLAVQAERASGSGTLDMDCLLLVPACDSLMFVKYPESQTNASDAFIVGGGDTPSVYSLTTAGAVTSTQPAEISGTGLMLTPGRSNRVFYVRDVGGTATFGDDFTAATTITAFYYPRYLAPARPVST